MKGSTKPRNIFKIQNTLVCLKHIQVILLFSIIKCTFLLQNYKNYPRIPIDTDFTGQLTVKKNISKNNAMKLPAISLYCCNILIYTPCSTIVSSNAQVCAQYTVSHNAVIGWESLEKNLISSKNWSLVIFDYIASSTVHAACKLCHVGLYILLSRF